jgi:hypothetical protein
VSSGWAGDVLAGWAGRRRGRIVAEFFDIGQSRTLSWSQRPQAAALAAALADPGRRWARSRSGTTSGRSTAASTRRWRRCSSTTASSCGPRRFGGRVDYGAEDHEETMMALGHQSEREITRTRIWSARRWPRRPGSRAGTWAAGRRTGTGWPMPGRTRTRHTPPGAGGRTASSPIPRQLTSCGGCSPSG